MKMTGAQILINCLLEQEVDTIFGYPGGTILNVYDALYDYKDKLRHVLTCHEQGASHAADGYARTTGKVGVCFATSGPGSTNLITGIATAFHDSVPVVFITCNVGRNSIGKDGFQEVDIIGITKPITKTNYLVNDVEKLAVAVREAFAVARSGRTGPVLIDIVKDVTAEEGSFEPLPLEKHPQYIKVATNLHRKRIRTTGLATPKPDQADVDTLIEMATMAQKPMLICGGGVVRGRASKEFLNFAMKLDAPIAITTMGGGGVPGRHPLVTGMVGMHGSMASNMGVDTCDLLIVVGCRFSDRVGLNFETFGQNAKIVHIDIDPNEINKNVQTDHHIVGDAKEVLAMLNEGLKQQNHQDWKDVVFSYEKGMEGIDYHDHPNTVTPKEALTILAQVLPNETLVTTDVGQHQMWAIQHFKFDFAGQLISSCGLGTMGFGLGAAIGAKAAYPERPVLHVTGDGSFLMNCNEMATTYRHKLPIITVIFNNNTLGMVRQWQNIIYDGRFSETTMDIQPDFIKLAEAYHLKGRRVTSNEELIEAINEGLTFNKQGIGYVIDLAIHQDEVVKPMIKAGTHLTDFVKFD